MTGYDNSATQYTLFGTGQLPLLEGERPYDLISGTVERTEDDPTLKQQQPLPLKESLPLLELLES